MTYIEISGSDENLEDLKLLSEEIFRDNGIHAKSEVYQFRQDSIEAEQLLPTLQVVFSGVIAVAQIINLVINIQEKRKEASTNSKIPLRIKIKASNRSELDLKISGQLTKEGIEAYQKSVQNFVNDFLSADDGIDLKKLGNLEIEQINSLIRELRIKLADIRVLVSLPLKKVGKATIFPSSIDLIEAIKIGVEETFYLRVDDAEGCKNIFYILERENVLSFHEESTNIRINEVENAFDMFVGYRVEILSLFERVISDKNFDLHDRFQTDEQHNHKTSEERQLAIYRQHNAELLELARLMASKPISIETNTKTEIQIMSGDRHIYTEGGNYIESNSGGYVQGNYIDMNQDLTQAAAQIQNLIEQLKRTGE